MFNIGDKVVSPKYGFGEIENNDGSLLVRFQSYGLVYYNEIGKRVVDGEKDLIIKLPPFTVVIKDGTVQTVYAPVEYNFLILDLDVDEEVEEDEDEFYLVTELANSKEEFLENFL